MRNRTGSNIKLGFFVVIGVLFFVTALYYIGRQRNLFGDTFQIHGIFNNVSGLQVGNNIRFSGINIGTIENIIIISDTSVRVDMMIETEVQKFIKQNAIAIIGSEGLMGNKIINITPGSKKARWIQEGDTLDTVKPIELDDILLNLEITSENAAVITDGLAEIIAKINEGQGTIGTLLMDSTFSKKLEKTLENVEKGTKGFDENMNALKNNFLLRRYFKNKERKNDKNG